jgi:hypothetical protein
MPIVLIQRTLHANTQKREDIGSVLAILLEGTKPQVDAFGGLVVRMLASGSRVWGFKPG